MALTRTSLAAAIGSTDLTFNVTSATGATVGGFVKVDDEYAAVVSITGNTLSVRTRGDFGGLAVPHGAAAPVTFGLRSDLPPQFGRAELVQSPTDREDFLSLGANGAIACPARDTTFVIAKTSALAASTLANPTDGQDGLLVTFTSATDFAHVVTVGNLNDGTTGNHTTVTFPAFAGASITLLAQDGRWLVKSNNLVVIT
jgi:hypothetical protein